MATQTMHPDLMREALAAVEQFGSKAEAARQLGIPVETLKHRFKKGVKAGLDDRLVQPAPSGHTVKGVSTLYNAAGEVSQQWIKTRSDGPSLEEIIESIQGAFDGIESGAPPKLPPPISDDDTLTLYPLPDLHLSLYAWGAEADENWSLQIGIDRYRQTMLQLAASSPPSAVAVILGGGDYLHANNNDWRTQSGNVLDGDGRTDKVIDEAVKLAVFQVDLALERHQSVIVRFLKGNHDEYSSIAIVYALAAWYRAEPRVTVDKDPSLFWWHRFGKVLLGAAHGHTTRINDMPLLMANRMPHEWGETRHRYVHVFHVHHKTQHIFEGGGVVAESHQSPVAQDAYHFGRGYLSARSMQSITYHRDRGETARSRVSLD
tara:strand:+ start:2405 stop:3529 length:1125 start_codon:yes stop_codon:yes gene_type:complete